MSTEPKIDWSKPLQTVRGWKVAGAKGDEIYTGCEIEIPSHSNATFFYKRENDGKYWKDGLPHGENPYDLVNAPEPEPAPDPVEALRAEVTELRERLAKIEAEKQTEAVAVEGVDWSKPLETVEGESALFIQMGNSRDYPRLVSVRGRGYLFTERGTFYGSHPYDLRNVVST